MKNFQSRDDFFNDRLSYFLRRQGAFQLKKISPIKRRVFYIESMTEEAFVLKAHRNLENVHQQLLFFSQLTKENSNIITFSKFPNGRHVLNGEFYTWTISPYILGEKLKYKNKQDRKKALKTIEKFHKDAKNIHIKPLLNRTLIIEKWYRRLKAFQKTESVFLKNGFKKLYQDIEKTTLDLLNQSRSIPWSFYESQAVRDGNWCHGDVASHNFIKNKQVHLIDFDLLQSAPQIYDYIQLGQRFLPHINWDLNRLLAYNMVPEENIEKWLIGILVPSDVIREWIHHLSDTSRKDTLSYLEKMEQKWIKRKDFTKAVKSMLK